MCWLQRGVPLARDRTSPEEFHIHTRIPHQITPQLCSRNHPRGLRCWSAVTPRKCKAEEDQDLPGASGAGSSTLIPREYKSHAKHTKSIFNQLLKLYGVRRGGTQDRARGGVSIHAAHSQ